MEIFEQVQVWLSQSAFRSSFLRILVSYLMMQSLYHSWELTAHMQNILLVDDDSTSTFLCMKTLERMGFMGDIHSALNGAEALDLFKDYYRGSRGLPHIILLDLNMPIMDGFGFLEAFNKLNLPNIDDVKIIVVSSSEDADDIRRVKNLGVSRYISKPLKTERLREVLERA